MELFQTKQSSFTHRYVVKLFTVFELETWSRDLSTKFALVNCLFGAVKSTKNADPDKQGYSGCGIGFDPQTNLSVNGEWGKNVIIFGVDNNFSVHIGNRKKDIPILGERPTDELDDTIT